MVLAVAIGGPLPGGSLVAQSPPSTEPIRIGDLPRDRDVRRGPTLAQTDEVVAVDLHAIESRVADRGPLDASLRWVSSGLRLPTGYDQVYRLDDGGLMRADGGLAATFDQSIYQSTRWGPVAVIPASTLFVIGGVPLGAESGHGRLLAVDPLDPGAVPAPSAPTATPDAAHDPHAVPGDRLRRFGYGPGFRMPDRVDAEDPAPATTEGSRFTLDARYRAVRLATRLSAWRAARREVTSTTRPAIDRTASPPDR